MSESKGTALITGSAQGIGRAIALRLARDGFDIALNDLPSKREELRALADEIEQLGRKTLLVPADVTVEEEVQGMVQDVSDKLGGLDVMVANVGGNSDAAPLVSTELAQWERLMALNGRSTFLSYKYAARQMIAQGRGGRILGAISPGGLEGGILHSAYSASKFAVRSLTQTAALELGRHNITVNTYSPGMLETTTTIHQTGGGNLANLDPELVALLKNRVNCKPIKYHGQREDASSLVSYLASKEAHFITGQSIAVDGGMSLS